MFVLIWTYRVKPEHVEDFKHAYGEGGVWTEAFANGEGYIRTDLYQDPDDALLFITLDHWQSKRAFERFQREHGDRYREIDACCDDWTDEETFDGAYTLDGSANRSAVYGVSGHG